MSDLFDDELLGVVCHWQDEHPKETLWFFDYDHMIIAAAYDPAAVWPLTEAKAIRRYYPDENMLADVDDDEDLHRMLTSLDAWAKGKEGLADMEGADVRKTVVFQIKDSGFSYSVFEFRTLH